MTGLDTSTLLTIAAVAAGSGIFGGILAGLLGVGGGIVIVPALYVALSMTDMNPSLIMQVAVGTSLATIVFTSLSSSWGHYKKGSIDFDILKLWAPAILVGVVIGGILGGVVSGYVLIAVFTAVALFVAGNMIFRNPEPGAAAKNFSKPVWAGFGAEGLPPFSVGYVNILLAVFIIPLSAAFARVGVKIAHAIPRRALRLTFGFFLLATAVRMGSDLVAGLG